MRRWTLGNKHVFYHLVLCLFAVILHLCASLILFCVSIPSCACFASSVIHACKLYTFFPLAAQEVLKDFSDFVQEIYVKQNDYTHLTEITSNELVIKLNYWLRFTVFPHFSSPSTYSTWFLINPQSRTLETVSGLKEMSPSHVHVLLIYLSCNQWSIW